MTKTKYLISMVVAVLVTVPGFILRLVQIELDPLFAALVTGAAILGASFLQKIFEFD
jgi:hypothetical protein